MERHSPQDGQLAALIEKFTGADGIHATSLAAVTLFRGSQPSEPMHALYEPALCLVAQGRKIVVLGSKSYDYSPQQYLLVSVDVPIWSQVVEACPSQPYLGMQLRFTTEQLSGVLTETSVAAGDSRSAGNSRSDQPSDGENNSPLRAPDQRPHCALGVSPSSPELLDAVVRLLRLLDRPQEAEVLLPLITREILYRLLVGEQGSRLRQIAARNSHIRRIAKAIEWIKEHYTETLRVEELARLAHMSASGFHAHFKQVTTMTPLQYQKHLRLQEARRLLVREDVSVAGVSYRVGYESPSQFSREYNRLFGAPPLRDISRMREALIS